ncbi:hypothetical protein JCM8547_004411, partial [Rhodosporidiobolus lusitaniae]
MTQVLANQHANGKLDDELVLHEMDEIEEAIQSEKVEKVGFSTFLKTKGNRHPLLLLATCATGSQGNGVAVFSYCLSPILRLIGVTDPAEQTGINGGMQIWNFILACVGASLVELVDRRKLWLVATIRICVSYIALIHLSDGFANTNDKQVGLAFVAFMIFCYGFYNIAWTPLAYSYSTEILPFPMRASGMVWMQNATLCINQWVNPIARDAARL